MKRILSIDGGGIKGVFAATILAEFEEDIGKPLHKYFDLIAGTSTGGIIAIGLALEIPAKDILKFYEDEGPAIFCQEYRGIRGWIAKKYHKAKWLSWGPKYPSEKLERALLKAFSDKKIGDAKTRLLIPAWHGKANKVYIYKTAHSERLNTDYKETAVDAAMATAAAPTYFREHITKNDVGLVDGGVWANNPSALAVAEGIGTLGWKRDEIRLLSIGCLDDVTVLEGSIGAFQISSDLSRLFMAGQSYGSLGMAHILTGHVGGADHKAIYRISQPMPKKGYELDDISKIPELKSRGSAEARTQKPDIKKVFFQKMVKPFNPLHKE